MPGIGKSRVNSAIPLTITEFTLYWGTNKKTGNYIEWLVTP